MTKAKRATWRIAAVAAVVLTVGSACGPGVPGAYWHNDRHQATLTLNGCTVIARHISQFVDTTESGSCSGTPYTWVDFWVDTNSDGIFETERCDTYNNVVTFGFKYESSTYAICFIGPFNYYLNYSNHAIYKSSGSPKNHVKQLI